jgi:hypothetical protein
MPKKYKIIHIITRLNKEVQQKIHSLLFWEKIRKKLGLTGNDVATIFSEEIMVKRIIKLYKESLAKKIFRRVLSKRSNTGVSLAF